MPTVSVKHVLLALVSSAILLIAGCGPVTIIPSPPPAKPHIVKPVSLLGQADAAWRRGDMENAERLYASLRHDPMLSAAQYDTVFSRLSEASLSNDHPRVSLESLQAWGRLKPAVMDSAAWIQLWGRTLMLLPKTEALRLANGVMDDARASNVLRAEAQGVILVRGDSSVRLAASDSLKELYLTSDTPQRISMERDLLTLAGFFTPDGLVDILQHSVPETDRSFPWSVLLLEKALREARSTAGTLEKSPTFERIEGAGVFADAGLAEKAFSDGRMQETFVAVPSSVPLYSGCTALALPLSGPYSSFGRRIAAGAEAARTELTRTGVDRQIILVDTDASDWLERLAALPPQCSTVGGPMLPKAYAALKARRMHEQRAFFAFLSGLDAGDEGRLAWRFFASQRDQLSTLLRYASQTGIHSFGVLYPDEPYGRRMAGLFMESAPGGRTSAVSSGAAYPPDDIAKWNDIISKFVGCEMVGRVPVSSAPFQAVFLPDSWDKSSLLIPYLFFNGADRMLILGSSLWEQGLRKGMNLDASNVRLAVFPAAWNRVDPTPAAKNLAALLADGREPDFWNGLGYDFVRFSAALNLPSAWSASGVNSALQTASRINWSMAPLSWSSQGTASQHLFVLNPSKNGGQVVLPQDMAIRLEKARERYDRRIASAKKQARASKEKRQAAAQAVRAEEARRTERVKAASRD